METEQQTQAKGEKAASIPNFWARLVILLSLWVMIDSWMSTHIGVGVKDFWIVPSFVGFVALIERTAARFGKGGKTQYLITSIIGFGLKTPSLVVIAIAFVGAGSLTSSIKVVSSRSGSSIETKVYRVGESSSTAELKSMDGEDGSILYTKPFIEIFGSTYFLEVSGYELHAFDLYPWKQQTIVIEQDLVRKPTVVFRVPTGKQMNLSDGHIAIYHQGSLLHREDTRSGSASFMIGTPRQVPAWMLAQWQLELRAVPNLPDAMVSQTLLSWRKPVFLNMTMIGLKDELTAVLTNHEDTAVARGVHRLTSDEFQDFILE